MDGIISTCISKVGIPSRGPLFDVQGGWKVRWSGRDLSQYQRTDTENRVPEMPSLFLIRYMISDLGESCVWAK